jgi:hypothetical protein
MTTKEQEFNRKLEPAIRRVEKAMLPQQWQQSGEYAVMLLVKAVKGALDGWIPEAPEGEGLPEDVYECKQRLHAVALKSRPGGTLYYDFEEVARLVIADRKALTELLRIKEACLESAEREVETLESSRREREERVEEIVEEILSLVDLRTDRWQGPRGKLTEAISSIVAAARGDGK